ncbi:MAG: sulfatase-like hydrolase/transferase, partial [Dehalococcoidia bacterium]
VNPDTKKGRVVNSIDGGDVKDDWRYESDYCSPQTFTRSMEWLERHYTEDFFLCIDTWDPHEPWEPPQYYRDMYWPGHDGNQAPPLYSRWQDVPGVTEEMVKKAHASYCGEVTMVDTWFGYLMRKVENMGLLKNTAVIFTSDHGYYFGEHGGLLGKMLMARDKDGKAKGSIGVWSECPFYEEVTHTPLLMYVPGVSPAVCQGLTSAVDLMPTVLEMMGKEIPSLVDGKSILPMAKDPSVAGRDHVISAHPFINAGDSLRSVDDNERITEKDSTAAVTTDEWALLFTTDEGMSELYNLKNDPKQLKNIIKEYPEKANELHQLLLKFMRENNMPEQFINRRLHLNI